MKTASWVIVNKTTGKAVFETYNQNTANVYNGIGCKSVNSRLYRAVPILEYLQDLNAKIKKNAS